MSRPAVFLDRDGTIIHDYHFVDRAWLVDLIPGAASAVKRLTDAGWPVIIVTNQSGIGRHYFTMDDYRRVEARVLELLPAAGAHIEATYLCPHHPDFDGPCECRKPGTLLFRQAAADHDLTFAGSWCIGDKARDAIPALSLGCRGIIVPNAETTQSEIDQVRKAFGPEGVATTLDEAADRVIESAR